MRFTAVALLSGLASGASAAVQCDPPKLGCIICGSGYVCALKEDGTGFPIYPRAPTYSPEGSSSGENAVKKQFEWSERNKYKIDKDFESSITIPQIR